MKCFLLLCSIVLCFSKLSKNSIFGLIFWIIYYNLRSILLIQNPDIFLLLRSCYLHMQYRILHMGIFRIADSITLPAPVVLSLGIIFFFFLKKKIQRKILNWKKFSFPFCLLVQYKKLSANSIEPLDFWIKELMGKFNRMAEKYACNQAKESLPAICETNCSWRRARWPSP